MGNKDKGTTATSDQKANQKSMKTSMFDVVKALNSLEKVLLQTAGKSSVPAVAKAQAKETAKLLEKKPLPQDKAITDMTASLKDTFKSSFSDLGSIIQGVQSSGGVKNFLQGKAKSMFSTVSKGISSSVGHVLGAGLSTFLGPLGPMVGGFLGDKLGGFMNKAFGGLFKRHDPYKKIKAFQASIAASTKELEEFKKKLDFKPKTAEDKLKDWTDNQSKIAEAREGLAGVGAWKAAAMLRAPKRRYKTNRFGKRYAIGRSKTHRENQTTYRANINRQAIGKQEHYLGIISSLMKENLALSKEMLALNKELKGKLSKLADSRTAFATNYARKNMGAADYQAELDSVQGQIRGTDLGRLANENNTDIENEALQAITRKELLELREKEFELQKKMISYKEQEIKAVKSQISAYKGLKDSIASHQQGRARKSWGAAEYTSLYQSNSVAFAGLDPNSKEAISLAKEQFSVLQKIEGFQEKQLSELQSASESSKKLLADLSMSDLNPSKNFASYTTKYESLKAKAQTGDAKSIQEYNSYVNTYLQESQKQYKSSDQYQSIFNSVQNDVAGMIQNTDSQINNIKNGTGGSLNIDGEYASMQDSLSGTVGSLDQTVNNLETALENFVNSLNSQALIGGDVQEFANGGISTGPTSGYRATLHGTEAVIPLKGGFIPLVIQGGKSKGGGAIGGGSSDAIALEKMDRQNRLLGELIDVARVGNEKGNAVVVLDTQGIQQQTIQQITEGSRRGIQNITASQV